MKSFLFINPLSGNYSSPEADGIIQGLTASGLPPRVFRVSTPAEIRSCCNAVYEVTDRPFIVVAAGDGTINAVLNALEPGTATIAVLPCGTANVLAAELGIRSVADGLQRIRAGRSQSLAVGEVELAAGRHRFALMAGAGLDGAVVRDVRPGEKRRLKKGAYLLSALRNCCAWDRTTLEVVTPDETLSCHTVVVCNASRYGGDFLLAPESHIACPGFTLVCVPATGRAGFARAALGLFLGPVADSRRLRRINATELEIRGAKPIQIDGDFLGTGPARITAKGDFAQIIV